MSLSLFITGVVNFITFLASIPLIGVGIWLATKLDTECVKFLEWPVIVIGVVILIVSLAGCVGSCYRIPWMLLLYLLVMFCVILILLACIIFAFVITNDGPTTLDGRRNYNLRDYSTWLKNELKDPGYWRKIKSCIMAANVCNDMDDKYSNYPSFQSAKISPVQAGCCTPPIICGYQFGIPTYWTNPTNQDAETDCYRWSNVQTILCYNCNTCKAGVAAQVKQGWRRAAVVSVVVLAVLVVVYIIGCLAIRRAIIHDAFKLRESDYRYRPFWRRRNWYRNY